MDVEYLTAEREKLHKILADKNGYHRGCGCDCAPLDVMARDLVSEVETLQAENKMLREATAPSEVWCPDCGALMEKPGEKYQCPACEYHYEKRRELRVMLKAATEEINRLRGSAS